MFARVFTIAMNSYREAVRARVLYGLLGLAVATTGYALIISAMSLHQEARVVADIGAASMSLYAVLVAIVIGATSLHRELELKTIFPILTRRLRRHEYVVGKYLGTLATLAVFVAIDGAAVLGILAVQSGQQVWLVATTALFMLAVLAITMIRAKHTRVFVTLPWSLAFYLAMFLLSAPAGGERQLIVASAALTMSEVAIVTAIATLFASFSSPFLTATFTIGVFLVGRSCDTLGNLPVRVFGSTVRQIGAVLARILPNLQLYVPPRPLLLGHVEGVWVWGFVGRAASNALLYSVVILMASALIFRKRDFQ